MYLYCTVLPLVRYKRYRETKHKRTWGTNGNRLKPKSVNLLNVWQPIQHTAKHTTNVKSKEPKKRRSTSKFDYQTAGGEYIPTESQNKAAFELLNLNPTPEQKEACNMVLYGYSCKEKVHHDFIHLINEYIRNKK